MDWMHMAAYGMYGHHICGICCVITYSRVYIDQLNKFGRTGRVRPSRPVSACPFSTLRLNPLTRGIPLDFRGGVHLLIPPYTIGSVPSLSGHAIAYRWRHCRESAGTGPVNLKAVPVAGAAFPGHHGPNDLRLYFPKPIIGMKYEVVILIVIVIAY